MDSKCPQCHSAVDPTDFFCPTCGKKLKHKPLSTGLISEMLYYLGSILLPPLGIWWGIKYLKQQDAASKRIGIVSIMLTVLSFIGTSVWAVNYFNTLSTTILPQLNSLQGL